MTKFLFILLIFLFSSRSQAQSITEGDILQKRLEQEQIFLERERQMQEHEKEKEILEKRHRKEKGVQDKEKSKEKEACVNLKEIHITGNRIYKTKLLKKKILQKFEEKCLTKREIEQARRDLNEFYLDRGYKAARVYFDFSKVNDFILTFIVSEGLVEKIELEDNSWINQKLPFRRELQKFTAFPFKEDKPFNLRDFEQGTDQINRLQSYSSTMDIQPGDNEGYSKIILKNKINHPTHIGLGYDNSGQNNTGRYKRKISLSQDNLLGLNDNIYTNFSTNNSKQRHLRYSDSFYIAFSIPLGYWTFSTNYSDSEYFLTIPGQNLQNKSFGRTRIHNYIIDRVMYRGQKSKISLSTELSLKNTDNYQNFLGEISKQTNQSRELTIGSINLNSTFYLNNGVLFLKPSYIEGLPWFNAKSNREIFNESVSDHNSLARAQYKAFKLYGYWNKNFNLPKIKTPLNYNLTLDSQRSSDYLFGSEQFVLGGQYTIRGFQESTLAGASGYSLRNDLKVALHEIIPNKVLNSKLFNLKYLPLTKKIQKTSITAFYDYGYVKPFNREDGDGISGYMSGAGVKLSYYDKNINWYLTYSKSIRIANVGQAKKDGQTLYFGANLDLGLF